MRREGQGEQEKSWGLGLEPGQENKEVFKRTGVAKIAGLYPEEQIGEGREGREEKEGKQAKSKASFFHVHI